MPKRRQSTQVRDGDWTVELDVVAHRTRVDVKVQIAWRIQIDVTTQLKRLESSVVGCQQLVYLAHFQLAFALAFVDDLLNGLCAVFFRIVDDFAPRNVRDAIHL